MKAKSVFTILLALVMLVTVASTGLPQASAEEATVQTANLTAVAPAADADAQLGVIYSRINELKQSENVMKWYYSVTDLDHDGHLEFIAASQHPVDRSTNLRIWEVSEDRTTLNEITLNKDPEESFPDIMTDVADTYRDPATGVWSYMCYDNIALSSNEVYTLKCAVSMKDNAVGYNSYAVEHTLVNNGYRNITFTDQNGFAISGDQFNAAGSNAFAAAEKGSTNFDWFTADKTDNISRLTDSYAVFTGTKEPTEVFPVPKPEALTDPVATPTPVPTATPIVRPSYLMITKNPTNETRKVGKTALFVACSNIYDSLSWTMVAPNGGEYSVQSFRNLFPGCNLTGEYSTTLSIGSVQEDMNCWGAYCTFYYNGQTARTTTAYVYVQGAKPAPTPTPTPTVEKSMSGTVTDYLMSSVTMRLENGTSVQVLKDFCELKDGTDLDYGCTCTVWYKGNTPTADNISYVFIYGTPHVDPPVYGSMNGSITSVGTGAYAVRLADGSNVTISNTISKLVSGSFVEEGNGCVVYYEGSPAQTNIYSMDIYGSDAPSDPVPGWMSGTAYHDTAFTVYIVLSDGSGYHIDAGKVNLTGVIPESGCSCTAYYMDYPSESNIYAVDIYGAPEEPSAPPTPEPEIIVPPDPEPEPYVEPPVYEEPVYEEPVYEEPAYEEPVYEEPAYEEPVYEEPAYEEPVLEDYTEAENG